MLIIALPIEDVPLLENGGVKMPINGAKTILTREGDYLCYEDNRCLILNQRDTGTLMQFRAASHGMESQPHYFIRPVIEGEEL